MKGWWCGTALVLGLLGAGTGAEGQVPPTRRDTLKTRADSLRAYSLKYRADSLKRPPADTGKRELLTRADTLRARADSVRKAQLAGMETTRKKVEVPWQTPDSVMADLLSREGYAVTQYQGKNVVFKAI
ncbi:MAG: hypothetical protein ACT4P7_19315, partial [Gemmatimonadaceae bacterium]